ncbi:adenylosuccinate lyase [uncultured Roseobacter sp.]|uniref:adenylosuccinate lyase n=1 Tax=uncultured Roseobacter sp. TaxID=114847 RepID=UPI00262FE9F7|nr:adenylosuccinate lyase [uncultured Roseobacter sp.]
MTIRTLAAAVALVLAPAVAFAAGCSYGKQAVSCAEGTVYDAASGTCVATNINS